MPDAAAQRDWLAKVLGVRLPEQPAPRDLGAFAAAWKAAVENWRDASDTTDAQITALGRALRASGDAELQEIAEYGLNAVTGNFKVKLLAILHEAGRSAPDARLAARARPIISDFRRHIETDERVLGCDENPFGVTVTLRSTLAADPRAGAECDGAGVANISAIAAKQVAMGRGAG